MIFAVIGDIRGNLRALEAALAHIGEAGIQVILHTGNAVVGGSAEGVVPCLRAADVVCVQGAEDRLVVRFGRKREQLRGRVAPALYAALEQAHSHTRSEDLEFLRCLYPTRTIEYDGITISLSHGTPASQSETVSEETPVHRLRRLREAYLADVIICGGAQEPFSQHVEGTLFVVPGFLAAAPGVARYCLVNTEVDPWKMTVEAASFVLPETGE